MTDLVEEDPNVISAIRAWHDAMDLGAGQHDVHIGPHILLLYGASMQRGMTAAVADFAERAVTVHDAALIDAVAQALAGAFANNRGGKPWEEYGDEGRNMLRIEAAAAIRAVRAFLPIPQPPSPPTQKDTI